MPYFILSIFTQPLFNYPSGISILIMVSRGVFCITLHSIHPLLPAQRLRFMIMTYNVIDIGIINTEQVHNFRTMCVCLKIGYPPFHPVSHENAVHLYKFTIYQVPTPYLSHIRRRYSKQAAASKQQQASSNQRMPN